MTTVQDILDYVQSLAPAYMKEDWDNAGLLCGRSDRQVKTVLVALDPFDSIIDEAVSLGADLIVTHHPLIFRDRLTAINDSTPLGRSLLRLIENRIAAINAHTNYDCAPGGVNDILADTLGLENIQVLNPSGVDDQGQSWGLLRQGTVPLQDLYAFLDTVKEKLHCDGLRYVRGTRPVYKVAVGGGACGGELQAVINAGCDTFVTSDLRYNQFRDAYDSGLNLIDAGHFHTENPSMAPLAEKIQSQFPEIQVIFSQNHTDPMKFY